MDKQEQFRKKIKEVYPSESEEVLNALNSVPKQSFWVNTLKFDKSSVIEELKTNGFRIIDSPLPLMFIIESAVDDQSLSRTKAFAENKIYIQQLSSAIPPFIINPEQGENILDLSAAPGSKASLMQAMADNKANITAVDVNKNRFFKMKENFEKYSIENIETILADGKTVSKKYSKFIDHFDKVLVDAPCSNEASLCFCNETSFKFWNKGKGKSLSGLQKSLLASGFDMLRPGGTLVYSTCTFSVEENEMVVNWLLEKYPNAKLEQVKLPSGIALMDGKTEWRRKSFNSSLKLTKRILPNEYFEGFYVAKVQKA